MSDLHIGAKSFDDQALLDFLQSCECEYLYLVGDIIDGWKLSKRWYWTENCSRIIDEIIRKRKNGTKVFYTPGNHDERVRDMMPIFTKHFGHAFGIRIKDKIIHTTKTGKRFIVMHGDQFDRKILRGALSRWSDYIYDFLREISGRNTSPTIMIKGQKKKFSLAKSLKTSSQNALKMLNNFEHLVYLETKKHDADGLICGHTHIPVVKPIRDVLHANAGSWLRDGHTALVEDTAGHLSLLDCPASFESDTLFEPLYQDSPSLFKITPASIHNRRETEKIIKTLQQLWPDKKQTIKRKRSHPTALDEHVMNKLALNKHFV